MCRANALKVTRVVPVESHEAWALLNQQELALRHILIAWMGVKDKLPDLRQHGESCQRGRDHSTDIIRSAVIETSIFTGEHPQSFESH